MVHLERKEWHVVMEIFYFLLTKKARKMARAQGKHSVNREFGVNWSVATLSKVLQQATLHL